MLSVPYYRPSVKPNFRQTRWLCGKINDVSSLGKTAHPPARVVWGVTLPILPIQPRVAILSHLPVVPNLPLLTYT